MYSSKITGLGYYVPENLVTNNDLKEWMDTSDELFLTTAPVTAGSASQPAGPDLRGVLAITPQARPWKFKAATGGPAIPVSRTQLTVLPKKQGTLHGVQGKTADPGFIVHWAFPPGLKKESIWLAYYVSLSRPRSPDHFWDFPWWTKPRSPKFIKNMWELKIL